MAKGAQFEREMCKAFSLWWTKGKRDDIFWRTSNSGGRATARAKKSLETKWQYGDMGFIDPIGESLIHTVVFEFKRGYQTANLHDFFDNPEGNPKRQRTWERWIFKAIEDAERAGDSLGHKMHWMIIHRRNGRVPICVMPAEIISGGAFGYCARPEPPYFKGRIWARPAGKETDMYGIGIIVMTLDAFFKWAPDPKEF